MAKRRTLQNQNVGIKLYYIIRTCAGYTSHKYICIYIYISMRIQKGSKDMQWVGTPSCWRAIVHTHTHTRTRTRRQSVQGLPNGRAHTHTHRHIQTFSHTRASYIIETYYYIDRAEGLSVSAPVLHPILRIFNARTEKRLHSVTG